MVHECQMASERDQIPQGELAPDSCGHATIADIAFLNAKTITQEWVAQQTGVPLGQGIDEEFVPCLLAAGLFTWGWFQTDLDTCKKILKANLGVLAVNYMFGNEKNPEHNHYGVVPYVGEVVKIRNTHGRGSLDMLRCHDFEQIWFYIDPDKQPHELRNWALVATQTPQSLSHIQQIVYGNSTGHS